MKHLGISSIHPHRLAVNNSILEVYVSGLGSVWIQRGWGISWGALGRSFSYINKSVQFQGLLLLSPTLERSTVVDYRGQI